MLVHLRWLALLLLLLVGSLVTLVLAVLVGWFLAGRALRPLGRITQTAQRIADTRDFSQRISQAGAGSEVGRLARVFNEMIGRSDSAVPEGTLWLTGFERSTLGPELAKRRTTLSAAGGYAYPASQTPWQEIQRGMVDELADGMVLKPAVKYQRIAQTQPLPRDNH